MPGGRGSRLRRPGRTPVDTGTHRFRLGDFECVAISDGSVNYPPGHLFANVPKPQVEEVLRQRGLSIDYVTTPYTHLYVDTGAHRVPIYDIIPQQATTSKRRILNLAAEEKALVMGQHFPPFPGLGYVVKKGERWQWQPIGAATREKGGQ
jgi:hypothetical protein